MRRHAYTLVELLIALSLSVTIILIAYTAFRFCAASFQAINRMSAENDLLRRGVITAYDTIDSWADLAEPAYPWCKGYNSLPDPVPMADKRPFRLVAFQPVGNPNFNPNWVQPHSSRAWYRNHLGHSPRPYMLRDGLGLWGWGKHESTLTKTAPAGWEGRHVFGDYSLVSHTAMDPASDPRGARPRLMLDLYVELGMLGVADYMPSGTLSLIQQPSSNLALRHANPQNANYAFNIGEVPYATGAYRNHTDTPPPAIAGLPSNDTTFTGLAANTPPTAITAGSPAITTANWRKANYFEGLAGQYGGYMLAAENDVDGALRRPALPARSWSFDLATLNEFPLFYDAVPVSADGISWNWSLRDLTIRFPWGGGRTNQRSDQVWSNGWNNYFRDYYAFPGNLDNATNTLYLLPQTYANDPSPNLADRPSDAPSISLAMRRYRWRLADHAGATVRLLQPETGAVLEVNVFATGTTFRGARQRWALASDNPATPSFDPSMGDRY